MRANCSGLNRAMPPLNCSASTASVSPDSRSANRSPTHTMGVRPASSAAMVRCSTVSLVSSKYWRRSLCPTRTCRNGELQLGLVGFFKILAPLAVSNQHVRATRRLDHRPGNLAREGAVLGPIQVLRADADGRALRGGNGRGAIRVGGTDHDLAMLRLLNQRPELLKKRGSFGGCLVHLPIPRHDWLSHVISGKKVVPFAILAPKFWATVWPISESDDRSPRLTPCLARGPLTSSGTY